MRNMKTQRNFEKDILCTYTTQNTMHLRQHVAVFYEDLSHSPNSKLKSDLLILRACEFACSISNRNQHDTVPLSINISSQLTFWCRN